MAFSDFSPPEIWFTIEETTAFESMGWQEVEEMFENFTWTEARKLSWVKKWRDSMLMWSDWTALQDNSLSDDDRNAWFQFRQLLRDIPQQGVPVEELVIPTPPWGTLPTPG